MFALHIHPLLASLLGMAQPPMHDDDDSNPPDPTDDVVDEEIAAAFGKRIPPAARLRQLEEREPRLVAELKAVEARGTAPESLLAALHRDLRECRRELAELRHRRDSAN